VATVAVTVQDVVAPAVTVDSLLTNDSTPDLTGSIDDPTAVIEVTVNGQVYSATNNQDGTWTLSGTALAETLPDDIYDVSVSARDPADNEGTDQTLNELTIIAGAQTVINEVDSDTPGADAAEFIELYDGGVGNTDLTGLVVVLYNGSSDTSYRAIHLDGYTTNAEGFFVVGNAAVPNASITFPNGTLQNGPDAVALYVGSDADFPNGTAVTTDNLLDALVYDTNDADDAGLLVLLNGGEPQVNEDGLGDKDNHSNSRVPNGGSQRNTDTYVQQIPTPGTSNENQPPADIDMDSNTVAENQPAGTVVGTLSTRDPDTGDTFTYSLVSGTGDEDNASFTISGDQLLTAEVFDYETKNSYSIRVRTTDNDGLWYEEVFTVAIIDVNDAPQATDDSAATNEDTPVDVDVLANDMDADGDSLIISSVTQPANGSVVVNSDNTLTYAPVAGFTGEDSFTYTVDDGHGGTNTATVTVTVTVNDTSEPAMVIDDLAARAKSGQVQLTWTDTGADHYNVYRSTTADGPYTLVASTTSTYSTYLDTDVVNGTTYYYVVRPVLANGDELDQSNEASATPIARVRRRR